MGLAIRKRVSFSLGKYGIYTQNMFLWFLWFSVRN